jgi:CBS domain-containing protein
VLVERILREKGSSVEAVEKTASIADVVALLRQHNIGALVVSDGEISLAGIISERDVVRALAEHGAAVLELMVSDLMTTAVATVDLHTPLEQLMALMTERRIRHVPVLDDDGNLVGVISIGDVVKRRVEELETEKAQIVDYITVGR